jgi:hypothetical protein
MVHSLRSHPGPLSQLWDLPLMTWTRQVSGRVPGVPVDKLVWNGMLVVVGNLCVWSYEYEGCLRRIEKPGNALSNCLYASWRLLGGVCWRKLFWKEGCCWDVLPNSRRGWCCCGEWTNGCNWRSRTS